MAEHFERIPGMYTYVAEPNRERLWEVSLYVSRCLEDDWQNREAAGRGLRALLGLTQGSNLPKLSEHVTVHARSRLGLIEIMCDAVGARWEVIEAIRTDERPTCRGWPIVVTEGQQ